ncbi:MAG: 50S ribosomal protein L1 [Candidatus Uhrbacteria bacterium]|nr:50S ribosomal protein L1 [Candidatus Uhrbacteria bacterium]
MPISKRFKDLKSKVEVKKLYSAADAIALAKETSTTKFDGSIEVHANLGIDVKKSDQQIRATFIFPNSIGKSKRVAAFVPELKQKEAKDAGADLVGGEELIEEIARTNKIAFDVAIATPDMMPKLAKIAKILGPKGIMPNPKTETVGPNVTKMVEELKRGKVTFKNDATGNVHQVIGKSSLSTEQILQNFTTFMEALRKNKPSSSKGTYIKTLTIASTMGPGIRVDVSSL